MFALFAEVPFTRFSKELRFVGGCLGDFVIVAQCWIIALTLWLEKVLDFAPRLAWIGCVSATDLCASLQPGLYSESIVS